MREYLAEAQENLDSFTGESENRFDDYDEFDDDEFDDDEFDDDEFDDDEFDGRQQKASRTVKINPNDNSYQVVIRNTNATRVTAFKLFGEQYGFDIPSGVTVTAPKAPNKSYPFLLKQSAYEPAQTYGMRLKYATTTGSGNAISYFDKSGRGRGQDSIVTPFDYENPTYFDARTIDMPYEIMLDGGTYLEMDLEANEVLIMSIYLSKINDASNTLKGRAAVEKNPVSNRSKKRRKR